MAKSSLSRREFLKISALNSSVLALSGCTSLDQFFIGDKRDLRTEVLILGAGAAGLAAAFELKKRKIPFRIFEASSRVGGRIQTADVFPEGGPVAELGAEFFESNHSAVFNLAKELNLPVTEIEMIKGLEPQLFNFNKKNYGVSNLVKRLKTLQKPLAKIEQELFKNERINLTFENSLRFEKAAYFDSLSLRDLLDLWKGEVDPLILSLIEIQAVNRFGVDAQAQSSLHFLSTVEGGSSSLLKGQAIYRMEGGLSRLTQALGSRIAGVIPDQILKLNCPLVKIAQEHEYFAVTFDYMGKKETYRSTNIICTIPFSKLREIDGVSELRLSPRKKENIFIQAYATHSKGVLGFNSPFWRSKKSLGNFTGDFLSQKMWDSGRGQEGNQGLLTYQRGGSSGLNAGAGATEEVLKDLGLFYADVPSTRPSAINHFVNWEKKKWSKGSMAVFKPGQYLQFKGVAAVSEYDGHFLFAGEHVSVEHQGTLQGALESGQKAALAMAEKMAAQNF
ncbi:MAG: flavin monoamine oxidase family protein [Bdellovibrio sp.]